MPTHNITKLVQNSQPSEPITWLILTKLNTATINTRNLNNHTTTTTNIYTNYHRWNWSLVYRPYTPSDKEIDRTCSTAPRVAHQTLNEIEPSLTLNKMTFLTLNILSRNFTDSDMSNTHRYYLQRITKQSTLQLVGSHLDWRRLVGRLRLNTARSLVLLDSDPYTATTAITETNNNWYSISTSLYRWNVSPVDWLVGLLAFNAI